MSKQAVETRCDRIPINYLGALCCVCIGGVVWYVAPLLESSKGIGPDLKNDTIALLSSSEDERI